MVSIRYGYIPTPHDRAAKARVDGVNASYKDLCNVCANIRGRNAEKALQFLKEATEGERPIRLYKFHKHRGHVGRLGGIKGGWPVKSCKIVRDVLANAMANAQTKGLGACKVAHIVANKQLVYGRMSAKGRRTRQDLETSFVEIVLHEIKTPAGQKEAKEKVEEKKTNAGGKKTEEKIAVQTKKVEEKKVEEKKVEEKKTEAASVKKAEEKTAAPVNKAEAKIAVQ